MNYQRTFPIFSIVFVLVYALCFFLNDNNLLNHGSLFAYYPALGEFHFSTLTTGTVKENGPVMMWYGWSVTSAIVGIIVAAIAAVLPPSGFARHWPGLLIVTPIISLVALGWMERSWFLR